MGGGAVSYERGNPVSRTHIQFKTLMCAISRMKLSIQVSMTSSQHTTYF